MTRGAIATAKKYRRIECSNVRLDPEVEPKAVPQKIDLCLRRWGSASKVPSMLYAR